MATTFEDAKLCPKCEQPGEDRETRRLRNDRGRPIEVHMVYCVTKLCPWYNTMWVVQINEDGTIPQPYSQIGPKQYPKVSQETETRIREAMEAQLRAEVSGHGEIRNPNG